MHEHILITGEEAHPTTHPTPKLLGQVVGHPTHTQILPVTFLRVKHSLSSRLARGCLRQHKHAAARTNRVLAHQGFPKVWLVEPGHTWYLMTLHFMIDGDGRSVNIRERVFHQSDK